MRGSTRRVLVAGTAGGVGTTTVTALLFSAWPGRAGAPLLADHTAGTLGARLPVGDEVGRLDDDVMLIDTGARGFSVADQLTDPEVRLVLVTAATPLGCGLAQRCLARLGTELSLVAPNGADAVDAGDAADAMAQTVLAVVGTVGRHRIGRSLRALAEQNPGLPGMTVLPPDPALAAGGRIPLARLASRTRQAADELAGLVSGLPTLSRVRVSG